MVTIKHPVFNDVFRDVPQSQLAAWLAEGWLVADSNVSPN
jgi:hypothetical protein